MEQYPQPTRLINDKYDINMRDSHDKRQENYRLQSYQVINPNPQLMTTMQTPSRPTWLVGVGGGVSAVPSQNIVDLESELKGLTFDASNDPSKKYNPNDTKTFHKYARRNIRENTQQVFVNFNTYNKPFVDFYAKYR